MDNCDIASKTKFFKVNLENKITQITIYLKESEYLKYVGIVHITKGELVIES